MKPNRILEQFDFSVAGVHLLDGPRPSYEFYDKAEWHTRGISQGLKIARTILEEVLKAQPIFPPGEPPAAAQPATERDLMRGWPLPWTYDTLNEKVLAADGHEVCDFGSSDRSEQDELAHWVVALANASLHPPASAVSPTLKDLAARLGWGNNMAASDVFNFVCEREQMLRVAQDLLETHKSNAPTAEAAIRERIAELKASAVSPREEPKPKTVTLTIHGQTTNGIDWKPAEASVPLSPEIPQRFTLVRETRQGGHYGEEQYEHVSMEPSPMGEWVKYEPLWDGREQLSPFRLSPEGQEPVTFATMTSNDHTMASGAMLAAPSGMPDWMAEMKPTSLSPTQAPLPTSYKCLDCAWYGSYAELVQAGLNHELCPKCEGATFKVKNDTIPPTPAPLKELIERRLELSEELRNGLAGVIAKQDEELKLLRAKVSALSPHPPTSRQISQLLFSYVTDIGHGRYTMKMHIDDVATEIAALIGSPHPPSEERK